MTSVHELLLLVAAVAGSEAFNQWLKLVFRRARPPVYFGLPVAGTFSFPSGH